jgi:hypothetical protein
MTGIRSSFVLLAMLALQAIAYAQAMTLPSEPNRRPIVVAIDEATPQSAGDAAVRQRAEDLATQASDRFSEILSEDKAAPGDDVFSPLWGWLSQSASDYSDVIVAKLKHPVGDVVLIAPPGSTKLAQAGAPPETPKTEPEPQSGLNWITIVDGVRNWLAQANSSYRNEIVKKLVRPAPPAVAEGEAPVTQPAPQSQPAMRSMSPQAGVEPAPPPMAGAQPAPGPAPSPAPETGAGPAAVPEARRTGDAAEQAAEDAAAKSRAEEIKRIADAEEGKRRAAEERRLAEEADRKAEADKAEARDRAEAEEAEDRAEARRREKAEAEAQRAAEAAEAKRKAAEAKRAAQAAEVKRRAEAEAERKAQAKRGAEAAEAKRKEAEAKRAADAAEAERKAEEKKRLAEEAEAERKAVEDAQRLAQAETKSAPEADPSKIPAADTPAKQSEPPAQDEAADVRSEPAQSTPVAPRAEKRKVRSAKAHGKKRVKKARRKVQKAHYRGSRKVRRKVYRSRRYVEAPAWSVEDARVYIVRRGDTLSAIAKRYYGSGSAYRAIYKANRDRIRNPHLIFPRQRIYIPQRRRWR